MGSLGGAIRGLQVGPASTEDEARLLSGHEPTWRLSHPQIRLSRLSFPAQEGDLAGMSIRCFLPARCQPDRAEGDQADDPAVGTPSPERPGPTVQSVHTGLDQLLQPLLQVGTFLDIAPDRCLLDPLGAQ